MWCACSGQALMHDAQPMQRSLIIGCSDAGSAAPVFSCAFALMRSSRRRRRRCQAKTATGVTYNASVSESIEATPYGMRRHRHRAASSPEEIGQSSLNALFARYLCEQTHGMGLSPTSLDRDASALYQRMGVLVIACFPRGFCRCLETRCRRGETRYGRSFRVYCHIVDGLFVTSDEGRVSSFCSRS